ncbi:hypothetical protein EC973_002993 [Apophysomyces ossiformis]|uniref:Protein kinase domain-containing protein n=1 Tax=Apophysomyces ossiformis TaxID=679940 RepID=A0A8H7BTJ0_9FUNG|nr:hypothetical protein EC973_002993 [Apophysomyces ossiformis]
MDKPSLMRRILTLFKKTHEKTTDPPYPVSLERTYKVTKKTLGVGSFAIVKECVHRQTGQSYALKIILKKAIADILKQVRHPNIVSMHGLYESSEAVYIVADLASGGELFQQLLDKGSYTEKDASILVRQMLQGLAYLHERDIVHRDIKPENLLFQSSAEHANLMITDFGLSKILKHDDDILTTACGTPGYVAPEVLLRTGHGKPVDLWSIDQPTLFQSIMAGKYEYDDEYWSNISDTDCLLTFDAEKRITAEEALRHPWIVHKHPSGPDDHTNLIPSVRKGMDSRKSFRSVVTAMTILHQWRATDDNEKRRKKIRLDPPKKL